MVSYSVVENYADNGEFLQFHIFFSAATKKQVFQKNTLTMIVTPKRCTLSKFHKISFRFHSTFNLQSENLS